MDIQIQAIHFDATEALEAFIQKKIERLTRKYPEINTAEITLKVVKPETSMNKEAQVKVIVPQQPDIVASKTANTFEEAVDTAIAAIEPRLEKLKGRK